ncbi:MAG: hypothetical protein M3Q05_01320, partial [Bacteroidota bacterium]|nr:hypothetical protein [Bacteroidota bacterium]
QSFVTREVGAMNNNITESLNQIRDRNVGKATMHQQLTMTSVNNLALMLNDALKQMQQQMAMAARCKVKVNQSLEESLNQVLAKWVKCSRCLTRKWKN